MAYDDFELEEKKSPVSKGSTLDSGNATLQAGDAPAGPVRLQRKGDFDLEEDEADPMPPGTYSAQDAEVLDEYMDDKVAIGKAKEKLADSARSLGRIMRILGWGIAFVFFFMLISMIKPLLAIGLAGAGWRGWVALSISIVLLVIGVVLLAKAKGIFMSVGKILKDNFGDLTNLFKAFWQLPSVVSPPRKLRDEERAKWIRDEYLSRYPKADKYVKDNGFSDEDAKFIVGYLNTNGHIGQHGNSSLWIEEFRKFQAKQKDRAQKIIRETCTLIAVKTAVCPWKILDMAAVALNSSIMIARIGRVYNRKTSRMSAFRLMWSFALNMYVSGEIGEIFEEGAKKAGESAAAEVAKSDLFADGVNTVIGKAAPFLCKYLGKVAEGGVNAFFAWRLGNRAIRSFSLLDEK